MNAAAPLLAVFVGGGLGACARYALSLSMNRTPALPLGTLAANLIGGYLVGAALAWLVLRGDVSALWRLFIVTGVLGGLTTFSTFSAEVVQAIERGELAGALLLIALHLGGALLLTALGAWSVRAALG